MIGKGFLMIFYSKLLSQNPLVTQIESNWVTQCEFQYESKVWVQTTQIKWTEIKSLDARENGNFKNWPSWGGTSNVTVLRSTLV